MNDPFYDLIVPHTDFQIESTALEAQYLAVLRAAMAELGVDLIIAGEGPQRRAQLTDLREWKVFHKAREVAMLSLRIPFDMVTYDERLRRLSERAAA